VFSVSTARQKAYFQEKLPRSFLLRLSTGLGPL
jgi:hypothetical protein